MAQQYNQFGQNTNQNPNATYNSIPGLFPTSLPFPPNFQQSWPNTPSWQANGQYEHNAANYVPGNVAQSDDYFLGQQADYIALDNGEEFFDNQDQTMTGVEGAPLAASSQVALDNTLPSQPAPQSTNAAQKAPPSSETSQMLNTLRAKLMKQKAAAEKIKSPEASAKADSVNGNSAVDKSVGDGTDATPPKGLKGGANRSVPPKTKDHVNGSISKQESPALAAATMAPKAENNSFQIPAIVETPQPPVISLDIEALFSSVRASEAAKENQQTATEHPSVEVAKIKSGNEKSAMVEDASNRVALPKNGDKEFPLSLQPGENGKNHTKGSTSSSEQLEQGEIVEEPSKSKPPSTKPSTPKVLKENAQGEKLLSNKAIAGKMPSEILSGQAKAAQPANPQLREKPLEIQMPKVNSAVANNARVKSNGNLQKPSSPTSIKPSGFKPKDAREPPTPITSRSDRQEERPTPYDRRGDLHDDHRGDKRPDYRESYSANRRYSHDRPMPYDRENERDRPLRGETYRPTPRPSTGDAGAPRSRIDEAAAGASEYRKTIMEPAQKPETRPDPKPAPKEDRRPGSKAGRTLEIRTAVQGPESPETGKRPTTAQEGPPEDAADIQDWLEMTGYFDMPYREKALARHRKLVELDRQRAELEMETKLELEERLHLARFSSLMPRASIENRSFTPQTFTKSMMPPPAVPAKEAQTKAAPLPVQEPKEDTGIQIKDLARRNSVTNTPRVEDAPRDPLSTQDSAILTPGLKRPHSGDLTNSITKPVEKVARTDSRSYSIDKKAQPSPTMAKPPASASLESRISVDNGTQARREYQGRSRSPEPPRRRSPSPLPHYRNAAAPPGDSRIVRRLSDDDGYSPLRRPDFSRNASPHLRQGPPYDGLYDNGGSYQRYERYHPDYDTRSNQGFDAYTNERRGGYISNRGRGRPRGRAGHIAYRSSYSKTFDRPGSE